MYSKVGNNIMTIKNTRLKAKTSTNYAYDSRTPKKMPRPIISFYSNENPQQGLVILGALQQTSVYNQGIAVAARAQPFTGRRNRCATSDYYETHSSVLEINLHFCFFFVQETTELFQAFQCSHGGVIQASVSRYNFCREAVKRLGLNDGETFIL